MIKHGAISSILVAILVPVLVYCISPDEVRIACVGIERKLSEAGRGLTAAELHAQAAKNQAVRDFAPDPFRPYGSPPATGARLIRGRLDSSPALVLSLVSVLLVIVVCSALLISSRRKERARVRRRHFVGRLEKALTGAAEINS
jgi:hypothetical protein